MAEEVDASDDLEVDVAKVDCVANRNLCGAQRIQAFPTLRFFKDGKQYGLDYRQDRTVQALTAFLKQKVELEKTMEDWHPRRKQRMLETKEHPGCMGLGLCFGEPSPGQLPHRGEELTPQPQRRDDEPEPCREPPEFRDTASFQHREKAEQVRPVPI